MNTIINQNESESTGKSRSMTRPIGALAAIAAALLVPAALTGCNTVDGVGQDIEAVGDGIQDASD